MAAITDLPTELIQAIATNLQPPDILSFRATHKILAAKSIYVFKNLFKKKSVMMARPSLEALLAISEHEHVGSSVRTLVVSSYGFSWRALQAGKDSSRGRLNDDSAAIEDSSDDDDIDADLPREVSFNHDQFKAYAAYLQDQTRLLKQGEAVQLLGKALKNLKQLRGVTFQNPTETFSVRRGAHQHRGILGLTAIASNIGADNMRSIMVSGCGMWTFERQLAPVLRALVSSRTTIKRLSLRLDDDPRAMLDDVLVKRRSSRRPARRDCPLPVRASLTELLGLKATFPSVRSLTLQYRANEDNGEFWQAPEARDGGQQGVSEVEEAHPVSASLQGFAAPRLAKLSLGNLLIGLDHLVENLLLFKETLTDLSFEQTVLADGLWNMLSTSVMHLHKLERLTLARVDNDVGIRWFVFGDGPGALWTLPVPAFDPQLFVSAATQTGVGGSLHVPGLGPVLNTPPPVAGPPVPGTAVNAANGGPPAAFGTNLPVDLGIANFAFVPLPVLPIGPQPPGAATGAAATAAPHAASPATAALSPGPQAQATAGSSMRAQVATSGGPTQQQQQQEDGELERRGPRGPLYNVALLHAPDIAEKLADLPF